MRPKYKNRLFYIAIVCAFGMVNCAHASEYASLSEAIQDTTSPRTYTLDANEISSGKLGNMGGPASTLTINGGIGHYGINNTSSAKDSRLFVDTNQTLYLQNLGTYRATTSSAIVDEVNIVVGVEVDNSINNYGIAGDYVGFVRSAGTTYVSNSVFDNNYGKYGAVLQNRQSGTMTVTDSVFTNNRTEQGVIHNDSSNKITEISDSIFYNNYSAAEGNAIHNKASRTIDYIRRSQFSCNTSDDANNVKMTGIIYNAGTIGTITENTFYNNNSTHGGAIGNYGSGTITEISDSIFANNTSTSTIHNDDAATIGSVTGSKFINNTATTGILTSKGSLSEISNNTFRNNTVTNNAVISIYTGNTTTPANVDLISNVTVTDNTGNALLINATNKDATVNVGTITESQFNNNTGHGLYINDNLGHVTIDEISNSEFNNNGLRGISIKNSTQSNNGNILVKLITDSSVNNNTDGGLYLEKSGSSTLQVNEISNLEIKNNTKTTGKGAGISNIGGHILSISDVVLEDNVLDHLRSGTQGGAIYNSGTIDTIANVTANRNSAYNGGGIYNKGTIGTITNTTISTHSPAMLLLQQKVQVHQ